MNSYAGIRPRTEIQIGSVAPHRKHVSEWKLGNWTGLYMVNNSPDSCRSAAHNDIKYEKGETFCASRTTQTMN